jgi:hypothetical protein
MLNVWTLKSGSSLGTIQERLSFSQLLPIYPLVGDLSGTTFSVISGKLPPGLRILDDRIVGTPFEVAQITDFKFVIRATRGAEISDRTFTLTVQGPDEPVWITPSGDLGVNPNGQAFILDNTYVDFSLTALDQDIKAGDVLEFFIQDGDGILPPGLTLSSKGQITGRIDPILSLDVSAGTGFFDTNQYDSNPFDFGIQPRTGMDSFLYDSVVFDYYDLVKAPRKLNRRYLFTVSVSDGTSIVKRDFKIYVVGDDFLRSDNTILQVGDGTFTADATYLRGAYWLSASNLGVKRANNYVTVFLEAFDAIPEISPLVYELAKTNPDGSDSVLPEGLFLDQGNGELFGFIPYQPAITREYQFTVNAIKYDATGFTEAEIAVVVGVNASYGQNYLMINPLPQSDVDKLVGEYIRIANYQYKVESYNSQAVMGGTYAMIRLDIPLKIDIPATDQQGNPTVFTKTFIESTVQYNTNVSPKTFQLQVLGEVDSVIKYITPKDLGTINANFISTISVVAESSVPRAVLTYQLMATNADGTVSKLPGGLSLNAAGEIIGKVKQYGDTIVYRSYWRSSTYDVGGREYAVNDVVLYNGETYKCVIAHTSGISFDASKWEFYSFTDFNLGLTLFDLGQTPFDGGTQTYDRQYKFTILAIDQFKYSAILGEFTLNVKETSDKLYSNIYAQPYQKVDKRTYFGNFITDAGVFTPSKIYRLNDPSFGVQNDLKMLIYAGIETRSIADYVPFLNRNIRRKRFKMGEIKKAIAKEQGSNDILYEVVYIEVLDDYEINKKSTDLKIKLQRNSNSRALVNQARNSAAQGDLNSVINQARLNKDEPDRFRPVKDPFTADNTAVFASGRDQEFAYPSSIINIRKNLRGLTVGSDPRAISIENEFLPLWMKTSQDSRTAATGFINAIPLCYCKPGEGQYILENVKNSGFDFGLIDYEIDRFTIDSTLGNSSAQVLKFTNYRYNV